MPSDKTEPPIHVVPDAQNIRGLGDVVAVIAKPIARGIDHLAGTDLEHCQACEERRDFFNQALPLPRSLKGCVTVITHCLNCGRK